MGGSVAGAIALRVALRVAPAYVLAEAEVSSAPDGLPRREHKS
jgi:hypothetical protein